MLNVMEQLKDHYLNIEHDGVITVIRPKKKKVFDEWKDIQQFCFKFDRTIKIYIKFVENKRLVWSWKSGYSELGLE